MLGIIIVIALLVIIALVLVGIYNSLVQLRVRADNAWADIDVQLKRRYDLIPNLVETVKGYAAHEKGTFENVAKFRSAAMAATTPAEKSEAEGQLTYALRGLLAVAEAYPAVARLGAVPVAARLAQFAGRRHPERPPLLQRRGARPEHQDPDLSHQLRRRHVPHSAAAVLRHHRPHPARTGGGEVLEAAVHGISGAKQAERDQRQWRFVRKVIGPTWGY